MGTVFFHVGIHTIHGKLPKLVCSRRGASVGEDLVRRIKTGKVIDFSKDHSTHAQPMLGMVVMGVVCCACVGLEIHIGHEPQWYARQHGLPWLYEDGNVSGICAK